MRVPQRLDTHILRLRQRLRTPKLPLDVPMLPQPLHAKLTLHVQLALLPLMILHYHTIDLPQRITHWHALPRYRLYTRIPRIDLHTRTNRRLRQIHRRYVPLPRHPIQRPRQLRLQRIQELPPRRYTRILRTRTTNQHNRGGKGVGNQSVRSCSHFGTHRPRANDLKSGVHEGRQHRVPPCGRHSIALLLPLLVCVEDGRGKLRGTTLSNQAQAIPHQPLESLPCALPFLVVEPRRDYHLFLNGDENASEQVGVDAAQQRAQPHVEVVGELCVTDVVVVRWVGNDDGAALGVNGRGCVCLIYRATVYVGRQTFDHFCNPLDLSYPVLS